MPKRVDEVRFIMDGGRLIDVELEPIPAGISLGVRRFGSREGLGDGRSSSSDGLLRPENLMSKGRRGVGRRRGGLSSDIFAAIDVWSVRLLPEQLVGLRNRECSRCKRFLPT